MARRKTKCFHSQFYTSYSIYRKKKKKRLYNQDMFERIKIIYTVIYIEQKYHQDVYERKKTISYRNVYRKI